MARGPQRSFLYPFAQVWTLGQGYGNTGDRRTLLGDPYVEETSPREFENRNGAKWHNGIDIDASYQTPVLAAGNGTIFYAGTDPSGAQFNGGFGTMVEIDHGGGFGTLYGHLDSLGAGITNGATVIAGQIIGYEGTSGNSSGPHLHFTIFARSFAWGSDVDPGQYLTLNLAAAQAGATGGLPLVSDLQAPASLPTLTQSGFRIVPVTTRPQTLATPPRLTAPNREPTTVLRLYDQGGRSILLPVATATVKQPTYLVPGSFQAEVAHADLAAYPPYMAALLQKQKTQVDVLMGYVPDVTKLDIRQLVTVFTGYVDGPLDWSYAGPQRTITLAGPDFSGLLSDPSATADVGTFAQMTASDVALAFAKEHNLGARVDTTTDQVGSFYGQDTLAVKQSGTTEWDVLVELAANEGKLLYLDGTTLCFTSPPAQLPAPALILYEKAGQPASLVKAIKVRAQAHSSRDYQIRVTSYNTLSAQPTTATSALSSGPTAAQAASGNTASINVINIPAEPNLSQAEVQKRADNALSFYQATELIATLTVAGVLPLAKWQPLRIQSDTVWRDFAENLSQRASNGVVPRPVFYAAGVTYSYDVKAGLTQTVTGTNRALGIQTVETAAALGF